MAPSFHAPRTLSIRVPASTSNLGPAFDCLGLALDLPLRVRIETEGTRWRIDTRGEDAALLRKVRSPLILRAMRRLAAATGRRLPPGARVEVENGIPVARGLGSSGAAIAAGLLAADALCGTRMPPRDLVALGASLEGHPENVAASLLGGLVICCPAGKSWVARRESPPAGFRAHVFLPEAMSHTKAARRKIPRRLPLEEVTRNLAATALLVRGLLRASAEDLLHGTQDALHQERRLASNRPLALLLRHLRAAGIPAALSGSGPSLLALLPAGSPLERTFATLAQGSRIPGRVLALHTTLSGGSVIAP